MPIYSDLLMCTITCCWTWSKWTLSTPHVLVWSVVAAAGHSPAEDRRVLFLSVCSRQEQKMVKDNEWELDNWANVTTRDADQYASYTTNKIICNTERKMTAAVKTYPTATTTVVVVVVVREKMAWCRLRQWLWSSISADQSQVSTPLHAIISYQVTTIRLLLLGRSGAGKHRKTEDVSWWLFRQTTGRIEGGLGR